MLAGALNLHAFVFNPIWLVPPVVAGLLNLRLALAMHTKQPLDIAYAMLLIPAEFYMWIRMGHFIAAWVQFFARVDKDNWAAQANAEKGRGSSHLWPAVIAAGPRPPRRSAPVRAGPRRSAPAYRTRIGGSGSLHDHWLPVTGTAGKIDVLRPAIRDPTRLRLGLRR